MNVYCVEIVSWENDGDDYQTKRFFSTSEETVIWIQNYVKMFRSTNVCNDCYGNDEVHLDTLYEITQDFIDVNGLPIELMAKTTKDNIRDFVNSLMGYSENYGSNWVRALERSDIKTITQKELCAYMEFKNKIS